MDRWDVIIAGAGPAGAHCARRIARDGGHSVLVLDRTSQIGQPNKSTAGVPAGAMDIYDIPASACQSRISEFIFESPNETAVLPVEGCVLDFSRMKRSLAEDAKRNGVTLRLGSEVLEPLMDGASVVGVRYKDADGVHEAAARIVIDATGPAGALALQLGLVKPSRSTHWIGMEHEMEGLSIDDGKAMRVRFDSRYAPGGYSWIFSTGASSAKVGNCWCLGMARSGSGLDQHLNRWISEDSRLVTGRIIETHGGDARLDQPSRLSKGGFMMIGDAARTINPLFGEGIRQAMCSAEIAAKVAADALREKDVGARRLGRFDEEWRRTVWSRSGRICRFVSRRLYGLPDARFDSLVRRLKRLPEAFTSKDLQRFLDYDVTWGDLKKFRSMA